MNYTETAAAILAKLNPFAIAYALAEERGEFRGFAALHDLFDANELLPQQLAEADDTAARMDTLNALLAEIDRQFLTMTPRAPYQEWTSDALDYSDRERMLTVECGPWSVVCTSAELESFETYEGEEQPEDYDPETMAAPRFCRFLDFLAESEALSFAPL